MNKETLSAQLNYAEAGEAISLNLAEKMIKDYNDANPEEIYCFNVGRKIIEQIFAQPGCVSLRLYKALNEEGMQTLVYAGVDEKGRTIIEYAGVNEDGKLGKVEGLIGDRTLPGWVW